MESVTQYDKRLEKKCHLKYINKGILYPYRLQLRCYCLTNMATVGTTLLHWQINTHSKSWVQRNKSPGLVQQGRKSDSIL